MLPALAYTIEPLKVTTSGGTMTTLDGAGVCAGPPFPLLFPFPLELPNGTPPWSRLMVTTATSTRPTIDRIGASQRPARPRLTDGRLVDRGVAGRVTKESRQGVRHRPVQPGWPPSGDDCPRSQRRGCP